MIFYKDMGFDESKTFIFPAVSLEENSRVVEKQMEKPFHYRRMILLDSFNML